MFMLTWQFWLALRRPQTQHPVYRRLFARRRRTRREIVESLLELPAELPFDLSPLVRSGWRFFRAVALVFVLPAMIVFTYLATVIFIMAASLVAIFSPLVLPVVNTFFGVSVALDASGKIAEEYDRNTYEVLGASPVGRLGIHWMYVTGTYQQQGTARLGRNGFTIIGIITALVGFTSSFVFTIPAPDLSVEIARAAGLAAFFALDYIQTDVISNLVGMLIPAYLTSQTNTRLIAGGVFIALQATSYLALLLIAFVVLPLLFALLDLNAVVAGIAQPLLALAALYALRAVIIARLWRLIGRELGADARELTALVG
ncbi:MAG: hypothetical protein GYB67_00880 [Chloroflexi bacterium]|nr:hypothetical protein [Chloroflexota bacterium]